MAKPKRNTRDDNIVVKDELRTIVQTSGLTVRRKQYHGNEVPIIASALTKMAQRDDVIMVAPVFSSEQDPATPKSMTVKTNVLEETIFFLSGGIVFSDGMVTTFSPESKTLVVDISAKTEARVDELYQLLRTLIETENFYRGKVLKMTGDGITFVGRPSVTFDNVILDAEVLEDYRRNTVEFLKEEKYHAITHKRGVILHGPPGTGKTSLVSASFAALEGTDITGIFLAGDSFRNYSLEDLVQFIDKYLTPALIVFEDVDLIGADRDAPQYSRTSIIGDLLSWLNGVEESSKPISVVFTTNRIDVLDAAVTRPCRIDRSFEFGYPTDEHLQMMWNSKGGVGQLPKIKGIKGGLTGAHIVDILNTVKMLQVEDPSSTVEDCTKRAVEIVQKRFKITTGPGFKVTVDKRVKSGMDYDEEA